MSEDKSFNDLLDEQSNTILRSTSSARFQIAKVSDDDSNSNKLLGNNDRKFAFLFC